MNPFIYPYLRRHVVGGKHPLSVRQLRKFLHYLHVLHEVHVTAFGQRHLATLHMQRRVGKHIQLSTESEVLLVVRYKLEMIAQVAVYIHRVGDVEAVKRHCRLTDGAYELVLKQTNMVVVDVHISKHLLEHSVQYLTRLQHIVHAFRARTLYNVFLLLRTLAVNMLCNGLVYRHRQYKFVVVRAHLHLVYDPLLVLKLATVEVGRLYVVERQRYFLVLVVLIVVVVGQVCQLLCSHHALH